MAYADYCFYFQVYYGDVLREENAYKWLERASDELDALTFDRLRSAFPENEADAVKIRKAVCAVAEALYFIEQQAQAAMATKDAQGNYRGAVASISSGRESISFTNSVNGSVYARAAADSDAREELLRKAAAKYLAGVPDAYGTNLLYAGVFL